MQAERTLNPIDVMSQLQRVGICYWSSYPTYFNASKIRWHRDKQKYEDFLLEITKTYESRSLEFLLGVQLFSTSFLEIETSKIISQECTLLNTVLSDENWNAVAKSLENLKLICTNSVDFNLNEKTKILVILDMLINISTLVIAEQWDSIVRLILDSTSGVGFNFNDFWGHPNHYLALKKE
jgi:hypothetical protein